MVNTQKEHKLVLAQDLKKQYILLLETLDFVISDLNAIRVGYENE